jgi:tetratricopeptide (TPR) repeat protein
MEAISARTNPMHHLPDVHLTALLATAAFFAAAPVCAEPDEPYSKTVIGAANPSLADGALALQAGDYARGVELTSQGLATATSARDRAAGLANLCAGFVGLRQFEVALVHCSRSLEIAPDNWRALNNRAAAWLGLGRPDAALEDLRRGLELNPDATLLKRSFDIAREAQARGLAGAERIVES